MATRGSVGGWLFVGEDRWTAEARRAFLLAGELGVPLDGEALIVLDVRELLALTATLRDRLAGRGAARPWGAGRWRRRPVRWH